MNSVISAISSSTTFNSLGSSPLFTKINLVIGLCLAGVAALFLRNLYKAYQFKYGASFGLDDRLKLVKCRELFDEAQEKPTNSIEDINPLLQECEALLDTITDKSCFSDKESLLLKLVQYYVKKDPDRSYSIAQRLSLSYNLYNAAQYIQKEHANFDARLVLLFTHAFQAHDQESKESSSPSINMRFSLKLAKAFHSLKNDEFKSKSLNQALDLIGKEDSTRFYAFCNMAKCYQEMGELGKMDSYIENARTLLTSTRSGDDLICMHVELASILFSAEKYDEMKQELDQVKELFGKNDALKTTSGLRRLANLVKEISKSDKASPELKGFTVEPLIEKALLSSLRVCLPKDRIEARLNIAGAYHEISNSQKAKQEAGEAFKELQFLPQSTSKEIESKINLLTRVVLFYKEAPNEALPAMQLFEDLYNRLPSPSFSVFDKRQMGRTILTLYNGMSLSDKSTAFFTKYLSDFESEKEEAVTKIIDLTTLAKRDDCFGYSLRPEQIKALLAAAEKKLSQVPSIHDAQATSMIAEEYLQVDRQKSVELLENYKSRQVKAHLITASITAIVLGILYVYPRAAPFLSLGSTVIRLL